MPISGGDPGRMLATLQQLLGIPAADLESALTHASNALADALSSDKVDAFLYDESRDTLTAIGSSTQPLSSLQRKLGLHVVPLSNGGRVAEVYKTGRPFRSGHVQDDPEELRGVKESLKVQSQIGIPLVIGPRLRGVIMIVSLQPEFFTADDEAFAQGAAHWVGLVAHRAELVEDIERTAVEQGRKAAAEELMSVLAHDLRNYVSPIINRLHLLRHRAESKGDATDVAHIEAAQRAVSGLGGLIGNLLDVTRLDQGLFALQCVPIDLVGFVKESAAALASPEHDILVRPAEESIVVAADPTRLRQCLDNLLTNAMAHSPRDAPVNVFMSTVEQDGAKRAHLEVVDEGPGIPEEMLPHLFERFATGRPEKGGMGLGLYLARRIAAAHGGELSAQSRPGKGARFVLRLPLYVDTAGE